MHICLELFTAFFRVGIFTWGGGYAMLPFIQNEVVDKSRWLSMEEFLDILGIAQMTPGPIAINCATFCGLKMAGLPGAIAATCGVIAPCLIVVSILCKILHMHREHTKVKRLMNAVKPVIAGMIIASGIHLGGQTISDPFSWTVFLIGSVGILSRRISPILLILSAAVLGLFFG